MGEERGVGPVQGPWIKDDSGMGPLQPYVALGAQQGHATPAAICCLGSSARACNPCSLMLPWELSKGMQPLLCHRKEEELLASKPRARGPCSVTRRSASRAL